MYGFWNRIRTCSFVIVCAALSACVTAAEIPQVETLRLVENVPFFPQEDKQCGPSSLAMVLNYQGVRVSPHEIAAEIFSESARGTLSIDMALYVQKRGLSALQFRGSMTEIKRSIDRGYPLVVLVDYGFSLYQKNHFMVVKGYDERGIIVNSGKSESKFIEEKDFLKTWEKTGFWTLLIKPK